MYAVDGQLRRIQVSDTFRYGRCHDRTTKQSHTPRRRRDCALRRCRHRVHRRWRERHNRRTRGHDRGDEEG